MTALQSSETWPAVPVAVNPDGAERTVKEVIVRVPLKFDSEFSLLIVLVTVIVQSVYVPLLREFKMMVLLPEIAMVVGFSFPLFDGVYHIIFPIHVSSIVSSHKTETLSCWPNSWLCRKK